LGDNGLLGPTGLPILATLTLLAGLLRVGLALVGGGVIVDFLPESVLVGFATGAGILIGAMQLDEALGLSAVHGGSLVSFATAFAVKLAHGERPAWPAVLTTVLTVIAIVVGRRHAPRWPVALLAVVGAAAFAWATGTGASQGLPLVGERARVEPGWPPGALPTLDPHVWREMAAPAAAIMLIGTLELTVSARALGARPDITRELRAQGIANVVGAFTSAFPASASLTRSALLKLGGAHSRVAAAVAAVAVVPLLFFAAPLVRAMPLASLAGILMITAASMIRVDQIRRMWSFSKPTRLLLAVTLVATLTLPLEWAILGGGGLGIIILLVEATRPRFELRRLDAGGKLVPLAEDERCDPVVVEVSGHLNHASVRRFLTEVETRVPADTKLLVVDLTHAHGMRFAALVALEELGTRSRKAGGALVLAGVPPAFAEMMHAARSELRAYGYDPMPGRSVMLALCEAGCVLVNYPG
jgi:SulP family sulfate permease